METHSHSVPLGWPELYQRMREIAGVQSEQPKRPFHVYIIKVKSIPGVEKIDYYVGSTGNTLEGRLAKHQNRELSASSIFKSGNHDAVKFKSGWMSQFPLFSNDEDAELAEGIVAEFLKTLGHKVHYSNKSIKQSLSLHPKKS